MEEILLNLLDDLEAMGYTKEWREKVLRLAMVGYMRLLDKVEKGETPRNRKGTATLQNRRYKRLIGIQEWFRIESNKPDAWEVQEPWDGTGKGRNYRRKGADRSYIESIVFVPHTP